jgi:hypothetical protein
MTDARKERIDDDPLSDAIGVVVSIDSKCWHFSVVGGELLGRLACSPCSGTLVSSFSKVQPNLVGTTATPVLRAESQRAYIYVKIPRVAE